MIKSSYFPNQTFSDKEDLFKTLKKYEKDIIGFKKARVYKSIDKGQGIPFLDLAHKTDAEKAVGFAVKKDFIYPIISTTGFMDSHDDVHFDGCFDKTYKEQQGNVFFVDCHGTTVTSILSKKKDVTMLVDNVNWSTVGKSYIGNTQGLIFEIAREKVRKDALDLIDEETGLQCSISMQYVKMFFACDSVNKDLSINKDLYDRNIDKIANKDQAKEQGYFFGVEELKIVNEGSLCPITGGSNSATGVYQNNEAVNDTSIGAGKSTLFPTHEVKKPFLIKLK